MPDLLEEKYSLVSVLAQLDQFTLEDLEDKLQQVLLPFDASAVLHELVKGMFITKVQDETLVFNPETLSFDPQTTTIYTVVPEQRDSLRGYVDDLKRQRFLPDDNGRPRGPNYRAAESLLKKVTNHPETLQEEENAITQLLALAQANEMSDYQLDPRQRTISEAYIKMLYGQFMKMKMLWEEAMLYFITSSQLFRTYSLEKMQGDTENRACEIFIQVFYRMYEEGKADQSTEKLLKVQQVIEKAERAINRSENQLIVFFSLLEQTSDMVKRSLALLRKQKIQQKTRQSNTYAKEKEKTLEWLNSKPRKQGFSHLRGVLSRD